MRTELFDYELPPELIASRPLDERDGARLCVVTPTEIIHDRVKAWADQICPEDLVVLNETRVRRARLFVHRPRQGEFGGARVELLFLEQLSAAQGEREVWRALGRGNRPLRSGDELELASARFTVGERGPEGTFEVQVSEPLEPFLLEHGQMPIPPYMEREADEADVVRYQTVFAKELGSAAAPTAGLHVTEATLAALQNRGVSIGRLLLHVGIGTFRPVQHEDLNDHPMHTERFEVDELLAQEVATARARGGRVIAIGTTAVRALESARDPSHPGHVRPTSGETRLLIQPGYDFSVVDALLTNFHMPKSTLIALVSAFIGHEQVMRAYQEAVSLRYRFLSYGDAMWLPRRGARAERS